ncbi:MAG TPA: zinc metalloprotease [Flavobacterium sp.]|nr:zinc metalloprotease [Flavobacterium sp.]
MKKIFTSIAAILILFACQSDDIPTAQNETSENSVVNNKLLRKCAAQEVLETQLRQDPNLALRMDQIEAFSKKVRAENRMVNGKIVIPVVVNVLYRTSSENISLTQIQSQIDVLNKDFNATNSDFGNIPSLFSGVAANAEISFELDAVYRKSTTKKSWGTTDAMKITKRGGLNPTSPSTKLNIWVCTIGGGILGYAQFPGGALATDGVVIDSRYFGLSSSANYPYNIGRTATHEVGHWLNLRHIWGDANCGNDLVDDTPFHNTANYGSPVFPHYSTCTGNPVEMTMNYMDYTDDNAMYMFTKGQKSRMSALFLSGGARFDFSK